MTQRRFDDQVVKLKEWIESELPPPWRISVEEAGQGSDIQNVSWKASEPVRGAHLIIEDPTRWIELELAGEKVDKIHPFDEAYLFPRHGSYHFDYESTTEPPLLVHVGKYFLGIMLPQYRNMRAELPGEVSELCWGWLPMCEPYDITEEIRGLTAYPEISSAEKYAYHILIEAEGEVILAVDSVWKAYPEIDTLCVRSPGRLRIFNRPPPS